MAGRSADVLVQQATEALVRFGAREVYLFGSRARGTADDSSDLDLAVAGLPPRLFFRAFGRLLMLAPCSVDLVDLDHDTPFTRCLREEGELVRVR